MKDWDKDYFKRIPSDLFDDPVWTGSVFTKKEAIIDLYDLAHDDPNNKGTILDINGYPVKIEVGEVARGYRSLSKKWGWSTKKVSNFIKKYEELGYLTIKGNTPITVIKINGWILRKKRKGNTEETQRKHGGNRSDTAMRQLKSNNNKKINENKERVSPGSFDLSSFVKQYKEIDVQGSYEKYKSYHDNPSEEGFAAWLDKDRAGGFNKKKKEFKKTKTELNRAKCSKCDKKSLPDDYQLRQLTQCCGAEYSPY